MKRDMPDDAGAHLVSGHPPNAAAPRPRLQNRVAIVTGGTGALGQAVTLRFLADGAIVAVPYAVETERAELRARVAPAQRDRLVTEPVDVTDLAAMTVFVERTIVARGRVDVLVGAVGGFAGGSLLETDAATWRRMLDLNLTSAFAATKAVAPHMVRARYGRVVLVASRAVVPPAGGFIAYTVSKAGVITLVQAPDHEMRGPGVTVNAARPSSPRRITSSATARSRTRSASGGTRTRGASPPGSGTPWPIRPRGSPARSTRSASGEAGSGSTPRERARRRVVGWPSAFHRSRWSTGPTPLPGRVR